MIHAAALFEQSFDAALVWEWPGPITHWNAAAEQLYGIPRTHAIGHPRLELLQTTFPGGNEAFLRRLKTCGRAEAELHHTARDGRQIRVEARLRLVRGDGGPCVLETNRDITERQRAEESLRQSKDRLHYVVSANPAMIYALKLVHGELQPTWVSDNVFQLTGFTSEEAFAPGWWVERLHPEDRPRVVAEHTAVVPPSRLLTEYRFRRKDGSYFWVRDELVFLGDDTGKSVEVVGSWTNITDRKQAEQELEFKNLILTTQLEASIDGILVVDENGRVLSHNRRFAEMWSIPPGLIQRGDDRELLQAVLHQLTDPEMFLERVQHLYAQCRETSHDEIPLKGGRTFDRYTAPMFGAEDRYYGRVWYFRDVTMQKRMQAQLIESQKMEMVGKLAGGVAHEFNSILTAIIGQSELLREDLPEDSPLVRNVREIRGAADRAAMLTRQLLAYGRKQILQPEVLNLNDLLAGMQAMLPHLLVPDVDIRVMPGPGLWQVKADARQIEQVLLNMAVNARDAMPRGGKLTLETANVTVTSESIGRHLELKPGHYVMLSITDTGAGMSEEVKRRAFEPFYTTRDIGKGIGLGLATCHGIIKQSGGHINVYSEPGQGTTFKIYLPRVESLRAAAPPPPANLLTGTETILLVEDDQALRDMAAMLLTRLGYRVLAAANGADALTVVARLGQDPLDLVFTDVVMPQMDGKQLADELLALRPGLKVLFASGYSESAIMHQGVLAPGAAFLQKPFSPATLALKLREVLDGPEASPSDPG